MRSLILLRVLVLETLSDSNSVPWRCHGVFARTGKQLLMAESCDACMQGCKELKGCIGSMQMQASRLSIMLHKAEVLDMLGMLSNGVALTCLPELTICNLHRCSNQLKRMQITHQCNMGFKTNSRFTGCPSLAMLRP